MNTYEKTGGGEELLLPNCHPQHKLNISLVDREASLSALCLTPDG
jgi:hypothetical protein